MGVVVQDSYYNAIGEEDTFVTDLDYVLNLGIVHAAVNSFSYEWQSPAQTLVWDWICSGHPEVTGLGRVYAPLSRCILTLTGVLCGSL